MDDNGHTTVSPLTLRLLSEGFNPSGRDLDKTEALLWAASEKNLGLVELLISEGADKDGTDDRNRTAVHLAIHNGAPDILRFLRSAGANLHAANDSGQTPLHYAVLEGDLETVLFLINECGADVNHPDRDNWTPLMQAARHDRCDIINALVHDYGAEVDAVDNSGFSPLHHTCEMGRLAAARLLVELGASTALKTNFGHAPLHTAVYYKKPDLVQFLINAGADLDARTGMRRTPLHTAVFEGTIQCVSIILESSECDVEAKDENGDTPLTLASSRGFSEAIRLLVLRGARIDVRDKDGDTPLHSACRRSALESIEFLLEMGADIEVRNDKLQTPLLFAATYKEALSAVRLLESRGASVNAVSIDGYTALHRAVASENTLMVRHFLRHGLDIEAITMYGQTPLSRAAELGAYHIVGLLLDHGAHMESEGCEKDKEGWRPLHYAAYQGHWSTIELLLERGADCFAKDDKGRGAGEVAELEGRGSIAELIRKKTPISQRSQKRSAPHDIASFLYLTQIGDTAGVKRHIASGVDVNSIDKDGTRALIVATKWGQPAVLSLLLDHGADANLADGHGMSGLWWAAYQDKLLIARELLTRGASVDLAGCDGQTPLSVAAMRGHLEIVRLLLASGANPNSIVSYGETPLLFATTRGHVAIVECLLEHGTDAAVQSPTGETALSRARKAENEDLVKLLEDVAAKEVADKAENEGELNDRRQRCILRQLEAAIRSGRTPAITRILDAGLGVPRAESLGHLLIEAALYGQDKVVTLLISRGADVNAAEQKRTALHAAAYGGYTATVQVLCDFGAKSDCLDKSWRTPLSLAAEDGHKNVVKVLVALGVRLELKDREGRTAIWHAARKGFVAIVRMLFEAGANINAADEQGHTPLSIAVDKGELYVARYLLERGARMRPLSTTNLSPLCLAVKNGHEALVELLVEYKADINHLSDARQTPLMLAAQRDWGMVATLLIELGAKTHLTDDWGRTAISYALERGSWSVVGPLCRAVSLRDANERAVRKAEEDELTRRMKYNYEPFPKDKDEFIRILQLHPGRGGEPISFDLVQVDLSTNPSFEALSYEWQDKVGSIPVQCGEGRILVTPNCKKALENLRLEEGMRNLWIDAVCINQEVGDEVNAQVALMADIYRKASKVILWLGEETKDTAAMFSHLPQMSNIYMELVSGSQSPLDLSRLHNDKEIYERTRLAIPIDDVDDEMGVVYHSSYFRRAWIFQEIILAGDRGLVKRGRSQSDWTTFRNALLVWQAFAVVDNPCLDWIVTIDHAFRQDGGSDITTTVSAMSSFETTDPRDKVFATLRLGSTRLASRQLAPPSADYKKTVQEVYVDFARYYLHVCAAPPWVLGNRPSKRVVEGLPTWAPDCSDKWSDRRRASPFAIDRRLGLGELMPRSQAAANSFCLQTEAYLVDEIVFRTSIVVETDIYSAAMAVVKAVAAQQRGLYAISPYYAGELANDQEMSLRNTNFGALLDVVFTIRDGSRDVETWTDNDDSLVSRSDESDDFVAPGGRELAACLARMLSDDENTPEISRNVPPLDIWEGAISMPLKSDENDLESHLNMMHKLDMWARYGRDVVYTKKGLFGITNEGEAEEGMVIALFPGAHELSLLRHRRYGTDEWYEYVDEVYLTHLGNRVESLDQIGLGGRLERINMR